MTSNSNNSNNSTGHAGCFKWLVGTIIALLAAGTGIVALHNNFIDNKSSSIQETEIVDPPVKPPNEAVKPPNEESNNCKYIRSLNNNYQNPKNYKWLDAKSDGKRVELQSPQTHGTRWQLEKNEQEGFYYIRSLNDNHQNPKDYKWLDAKSDGKRVELQSQKTHGTRWKFTRIDCPY